ncbi:hypothetical protein E2C01_089235 [Portunus trituberculatus]|uniref:Uncharacterized protein n=1 Tax=Portunus trituberculatus TaxID=210409 RepID=A0A5B7JI86_PORTR|nr:hypothetical protein [Portunus trituberculatus]
MEKVAPEVGRDDITNKYNEYATKVMKLGGEVGEEEGRGAEGSGVGFNPFSTMTDFPIHLFTIW